MLVHYTVQIIIISWEYHFSESFSFVKKVPVKGLSLYIYLYSLFTWHNIHLLDCKIQHLTESFL